MKYSAKIYLKNRKKWERINSLLEEISQALSEAQEGKTKLDELMVRMLRDLAGKTKKLPIQINNKTLVIGKQGFGILYSYDRKAKYIHRNIGEILEFLSKDTASLNVVMSAIKRKDKKEILASFLKFYEPDTQANLELSIKVSKTIVDVDSDGGKEYMINSIRVASSSGFQSMGLRAYYSNGSIDLNDDGIGVNMVKEQLYLPCWKLLVKAKRHAMKHRKKSFQKFARVKKSIEPYWFAEKLAENTEAIQ